VGREVIRFWNRLDRLGRALLVGGHLGGVAGLVVMILTWHSYWSQYVATNVLPPSVWTLVGMAVMHLRLHAKLDANHQDIKQHVTASTGGSDGNNHSEA
jgi:hypothetical protein